MCCLGSFVGIFYDSRPCIHLGSLHVAFYVFLTMKLRDTCGMMLSLFICSIAASVCTGWICLDIIDIIAFCEMLRIMCYKLNPKFIVNLEIHLKLSVSLFL